MKTLTDIQNEYLDHLKMLNYSKTTLKCIQCHCSLLTNWLFTSYSVTTCERINKNHTSAWLKHVNGKNNKKGLPLKAVSVNNIITHTRGFLEYMAKQGFIIKSLSENLEHVKSPSHLPVNILSNAKVKKMLRKIDLSTSFGCRDRAILELMYTAGLRSCEVTSLNIENIDIKNNTARVMGKGNKERIVPIGKTAMRYLNSWMVGIRPFMIDNHTERALFVNKYSRRITYPFLLRMIKKHARNAKLPDGIGTHCLRRACTTELVKSGANLYHIKELLGHENFNTLKHYAKLSIRDLQKTHEKHHPRERESK